MQNTSGKVSPESLFPVCLSPLSPVSPPAARVCDNELLRCQNGGVCVNNVRCSCPSDYSGLLCEKSRCEAELGGCRGPDSGAALPAPPLRLLLLLLGSALLGGASAL